MTISSTVRKQWLQVATDILDPAEKLVIRVFDQLGDRRVVRKTVTGTHTTEYKSLIAFLQSMYDFVLLLSCTCSLNIGPLRIRNE